MKTVLGMDFVGCTTCNENVKSIIGGSSQAERYVGQAVEMGKNGSWL